MQTETHNYIYYEDKEERTGRESIGLGRRVRKKSGWIALILVTGDLIIPYF